MSSLLCSAFYLFKTFERLRPRFSAEINFQQSLFIGGGSPQNLRKLVRLGGLQLREKRSFIDHRGNSVTNFSGSKLGASSGMCLFHRQIAKWASRFASFKARNIQSSKLLVR